MSLFFSKCLIVLARKNLQFAFIAVGIGEIMKAFYENPFPSQSN